MKSYEIREEHTDCPIYGYKHRKNYKHFLSMTYLIAMQSEDPHTNVGAVIVGPDWEIRSTGYNGLPRGCKDFPYRLRRPEKYKWFEHAERNAIYNAARMGLSLKGCKMFINALPCEECARGIIQAGITTVIYHKRFEETWSRRPQEARERTLEMLYEGGVLVHSYDEDITTNILAKRDGKLINIK